MSIEAGSAMDGTDNLALSDDEVRNRLEYLADILLDLQALTGTAGGATLNGLLALAHCEALLQVKRISEKPRDHSSLALRPSNL